MHFRALPKQRHCNEWRTKFLLMKLTTILLLAACLQVSARGLAQKITLSEKNASLQRIFKLIHKQTGYQFFYETELLDRYGNVNVEVKDAPLEKVLAICFNEKPLNFTVRNKSITVTAKKFTPLPEKKEEELVLIEVKGKVTDENGTPLSGASIKLKGSTAGTSTDADGNFSLQMPEGGGVLLISYIGFQTRELRVSQAETLNIALQLAETQINEVVVTALGIKRSEKALGYAVQRVSGEKVQTVKGVDVATSLTGQVAGLVIKNSTEFFARPTIELRGEEALLVIDGVPYGNLNLRDIPTDDIESLDVLKGPTASALYGSRASGGVLLITTKKGAANKGLSVDINSNTMLQTGFLAIPEVQGNYGRGDNGSLGNDYVWGPRLNAGNTARDWNPVTKQFEDDRPLLSKGKDNLKNFMQLGLITNNNLSISQRGENGSFRASINHIYNKGQFPNAKTNMFNITLGGEVKAGERFTLESHMGISRRNSPQIWGSGYGNQGYLYQLMMWTGPEYDIREYKDYWKTPNQTQNWMYTAWYDNPYLIANEKLQGILQNTINGSLTANYKITNDLKLILRVGYDVFSNKETWTNPTANIYSTRGGWNARGRYSISKDWGWSTNDDLMLSYTKKKGKWNIDLLAGGTIYYWEDESLDASTRNGLTSPTYFSLNGSVEPPTISPRFFRRQVNSLYGKASVGWKDAVFLDFTGRNDWNSAQPKSNRDYFYPSIGSSVVLSELIQMPRQINMLKLRASWATFKTPADVYAINRLYSTTNSAWNTMNSGSYPGNLLGSPDLMPSSHRTWEIGTAAYLFGKRLHIDVAYFNKYYYNRQVSVNIPGSSGFNTTLVNTDETYVRKGLEITVGASVVKTKDLEWNTTINWSNQHRFYVNLDSVYSSKNPWVKKGERLDTYLDYYWLRDNAGNVIHNNGYPRESDYVKKYGFSDPAFSFGWINTVRWKNFQFGLNVDGRIGGLMYNYVYDKMWDTGTNPESDNQYRYDEVVNGLTNYVGQGVQVISGEVVYDNFGNIISDSRKYGPNDKEVSYQAYAQQFRGGDFGIQKKSFVKLREISAGYRIPSRVLGKSGIKSASVAITAQNVFLFSNFKFSDPDVDTENLNSPSQRMIGINFKFGF
ncbi:SusC/RagA family TonB-linked outer membrane protein [Flavihumibacter sp. UBA7668]|uniref:SusC/RagA family TonB-linked outer membrane protein n=1 Tax=Flavihumibacter sp. UBA7668 TaxID=1946542 RepID=UPI0025C256D0|nr:SusC/RagA family TonB-linked outer membrane protein [Flavihumibacter sp. UBA7668]